MFWKLQTLKFLFIFLLSENHEAGSAMGKSQLHLTNNMLVNLMYF